jgi:hypothetical protein
MSEAVVAADEFTAFWNNVLVAKFDVVDRSDSPPA